MRRLARTMSRRSTSCAAQGNARLRDGFLAKVIVGQADVIERLAICLFARGHVLLMGVPGLAKTFKLVSKLAETMSPRNLADPFTPDQLPTGLQWDRYLQDGAQRRGELKLFTGPSSPTSS